MGLSTAAIRFLVREHRRRPFGRSVLTLGRQGVYATFAEVLHACREEGVTPQALPPETPVGTNIPQWRGTPDEGRTSDVALFRTLGAAEVLALDCADFEGAEVIADLNQPLPEALAGRFDLVLDSGTLEHVFDVRVALANVGRLLRPGGRVIHMSPCNDYANHGFYQFGPTLLLDYYSANGFDEVRAFVAELTADDYAASRWDLFEIDAQHQPVLMTSRRRLLLIAVAEKTERSTVDCIPTQAYYRQLFAAEPPTASPPSRFARLRRFLPAPLKTLLRRWLRRDPQRKPWGLIPRGRL